MSKELLKLADQLGETLSSSKDWTKRRVSSHWVCSFAKLGSSFLIIDFEGSAQGNQSDWERLLSDREQFLKETDFSEGIIEVWLGGGALISSLNVEARPWLTRSLGYSVGRLWAWVALGALPSLKASFLLSATKVDPSKTSFGMDWVDNMKDLAPLLKKRARGWDEWKSKVRGAEHHLEEGNLFMYLNVSGQVSGFGLLNVSLVERVLNWLTLIKVVTPPAKSLDPTHLGFLTRTAEKTFIHGLERMGIQISSVSGQEDDIPQECYRQMYELLRDDVEHLNLRSDSLHRELSRERQRVVDAVGEKTAFVNILRNELSASLNGVSSMLTLLNATELGDEQKEYLELASNASSSMSTTLSRLQDYVALDAGQVDIKMSKVEVGTFLVSFSERWRPMVEKKGLSLDLDHFAPSSLKIKMDEQRVTKILDELIKNSMAHTQEGGIVIKSELVEDGKKEVSLRFEISDSGAGMEDNQVNAIFREFSRQDLFGVRRFENLGIGLSLCHKLSCFMGGKMGVYSSRGQGARFWVVLKLDRVRPGREKCPVAEMKGLKVLEGMNALVVDDNPISRKVLVQQLETFGFQVDVTGSSYAALELLRSQPYHFLMLGLSMPDMKCFDFMSSLKADFDGTEENVPRVLGLCRSVSAELHGKCLEMGMDGVLGKPLAVSSLRKFFTDHFVS